MVAFVVVTNAVVAIAVELFPADCVTAVVPVGKTGVPVNVGDAKLAFNANQGTVGKSAVPPRSFVNLIFPLVVASASTVVELFI